LSRTLFIVGGGTETVPAVHLAQRMGLHVVVSDMNPQAPALQAADDGIIASTYDVAATVAAAEEFQRKVRPINGVICVATDVPLTVATVADALGLPGIPLAAARLAMDKLAMKQQFAVDGVAIPWFCQVESARQLKSLVAERGTTLVITVVGPAGCCG